MRLLAPAHDVSLLHRRLFESSPDEGAAFLAVEPSGNHLVLRSSHVFESDEREQGNGELTIREDSQLARLAAAQRQGHALVEVHTHPGSGDRVNFSRFDDSQLPRFARYVRLKLRGRPFGALVLGERSQQGRIWRTDSQPEPLALQPVGEAAAVPAWLDTEDAPDVHLDPMFDRQIRALGPTGQRKLANLRVGIVGLGGTGSQIVQQLTHIGVRSFVLVEDDRTERSNIPRLAGARRRDASLHRSKAAVSRRLIRRVGARTHVLSTGTLRTRRSLRELMSVDLIVGCVDNDGARLILAELSAAHLVSYLDLGVGIETESGLGVGGRSSFYLPGGPCLACADELDLAEAAEDLESEGLHRIRVQRGYARDRRVEPALMPLNGVVASLGMMEVLAFTTGFRPVSPFLRYDALAQKVVSVNATVQEQCPVCRPAHAMGDRQAVLRYAFD